MSVRILYDVFPHTVMCANCKSVLAFEDKDISIEQEYPESPNSSNIFDECKSDFFFGVRCPNCGQYAVIEKIPYDDIGKRLSEVKRKQHLSLLNKDFENSNRHRLIPKDKFKQPKIYDNAHAGVLQQV